jgi:hypothetical protein
MKLLNQDGLSLKPVLIMLALIGGLVYYMMKDIKKIKSNQSVTKTNSEDLPVLDSPSETKLFPHDELLKLLAIKLRRPGVCQNAFVNREGKLAKFLNSDEIPKSEDIVKIVIDDETFLEIDQQVESFKVQDIYFTTTEKAPLVNEGNTLVVNTDLQVVWLPVQGGEAIPGKPVSLQLITDSSGQVINGCKFEDSDTSTPAKLETPPPERDMQAKELAEPIPHKIPKGSICGVINFECSGSFVGDSPNIPPHTAEEVEGIFCEDHKMSTAQCVFSDPLRGFRIEGLSCPEGYRPITHTGHLGHYENNEGATKTTKILQRLMVMCVKR